MDCKIKYYYLFLIPLVLFFGCNRRDKITRCFYYWKQTLSVSEKEEKSLSDLKISKLYVRFFDVQWIEEKQEAYPVSRINFANLFKKKIEIIPVVYIENAVFKNINSNQTDSLSEHISSAVNSIIQSQSFKVKEIQFDCDWTESTKEKYFQFLSNIKSKTQFNIGATIRLHQIKYKERTGVPPVNYGVLMYYNMGSLNTLPNSNSIYSSSTAANYKDYIHGYPLHLDVALGLFSWGVQSRNGKGIRVINNWNNRLITKDAHFQMTSINNYICVHDTVVNQEMIYSGDRIKIEETSADELYQISEDLSEEIKNDSLNVIFYHLDDLILTNYETKELETIYENFN